MICSVERYYATVCYQRERLEVAIKVMAVVVKVLGREYSG